MGFQAVLSFKIMNPFTGTFVEFWTVNLEAKCSFHPSSSTFLHFESFSVGWRNLIIVPLMKHLHTGLGTL